MLYSGKRFERVGHTNFGIQLSVIKFWNTEAVCRNCRGLPTLSLLFSRFVRIIFKFCSYWETVKCQCVLYGNCSDSFKVCITYSSAQHSFYGSVWLNSQHIWGSATLDWTNSWPGDWLIIWFSRFEFDLDFSGSKNLKYMNF